MKIDKQLQMQIFVLIFLISLLETSFSKGRVVFFKLVFYKIGTNTDIQMLKNDVLPEFRH